MTCVLVRVNFVRVVIPLVDALRLDVLIANARHGEAGLARSNATRARGRQHIPNHDQGNDYIDHRSIAVLVKGHIHQTANIIILPLKKMFCFELFRKVNS
jgi:hypothetical protein